MKLGGLVAVDEEDPAVEGQAVDDGHGRAPEIGAAVEVQPALERGQTLLDAGVAQVGSIGLEVGGGNVDGLR